MKIINATCAKGRTGFFFDDQKAIKNGAVADGESYKGKPETPGFTSVRQAGESISILLLLEDGQVAWGDCAAVQYTGVGGRDPIFLASEFIPLIEKEVFPQIIGQEADDFRRLAAELDKISVKGEKLHAAIRYGVSQALLDAVAKSGHELMADVIAREYHTTISEKELPIFTQSGDARYSNPDKMIIKEAQVLPHALINHVETKLGKNGEILLEYVTWLKNRILELRVSKDYNPQLHIDVYGTIGNAFGAENYEAMLTYFKKLQVAASPLKLRIEGPVDMGSREKQIEVLAELRKRLEKENIGVEIVADEWCNTLEDIKLFADAKAGHMLQIKTPDLGNIADIIEAVLYCKEKGAKAYLGGTCNETDRSAQVCVHIGMATKPEQILAKPGMGVDEGYMIVYNEMQRILAMEQLKRK